MRLIDIVKFIFIAICVAVLMFFIYAIVLMMEIYQVIIEGIRDHRRNSNNGNK